MESIISDESKFIADVDSDGLRKLERKVDQNLRKLLEKNAVKKDELNLLNSMGSVYSDQQGPLKVHKLNIPL